MSEQNASEQLPTTNNVESDNAELPKIELVLPKEIVYRRFSSAEYSNIARMMREHHTIFSEMWAIGTPMFSNRVPTACVVFDKEGTALQFEINPDFWETLTDIQKCFVISHESAHVFLNHGARASAKVTARANRTMDIVVNHTLVNNFGFSREEIDPENKYCWIDTVFKDSPVKIKENESFEYYYKMLTEQANRNGGDGADGEGGVLVDDHGTMMDVKEFLEKFGDRLSDKAKEELKEFIEKHISDEDKKAQKAGNEPGGMFKLLPKKRVKKKKKWETVIRKWTKNFLNALDKEKPQWVRTNRRFTAITSELMLPSDYETHDVFVDKKISLVFFTDTSGSCSHLGERFFNAAASLDRDKFDIKLVCFDTKCYETTLESRKLYGFGGTAFDILEDYIQKKIKNNGWKYPDSIFILTDGYGTHVTPEHPKRWHWFLTEPYLECIPSKSKWYNLQDFE